MSLGSAREATCGVDQKGFAAMGEHGRMEAWTAAVFLGLALIGALGAAAARYR
jgi:hypothetical protein